MSYCRYENTYRDLLNCYEIAEGMGIDSLRKTLSESEFDYMLSMIDLCKQIAQNYDGDYDGDELY